MPPVGFKPTISAGERPQTYAFFARYTLEFVLQLRKKHGKTSARVAGECQLAKSIRIRAYMSIRIHKYSNKNT